MEKKSRDYFARKAQVKKELEAAGDPFPYVFSLENWKVGTTEGCVVQVTIDNAAGLMANDTHRLATAEEIRGFVSADEKRGQQYEALELKKAKRIVMYQQPEPTPARKSKTE
jgi:hypothetical protein